MNNNFNNKHSFMKGKFLLILFACVLGYTSGFAQSFGTGNLVVLRLGTTSVGSYGAQTYLDEYNTSGVFQRTVILPAVAPTTSAPSFGASIWGSGTSMDENRLSLSTNGQYITYPGYLNSNSNVAWSSSSIGFPRTIARVKYDGTYTLFTPPVTPPNAAVQAASVTTFTTVGYNTSMLYGTIAVGQYVFGPGITTGTTVSSMSAAPSSVAATWTANSTTINCNITGLVPGLMVSGTGIPANAYISAIGASSFTLSASATGTGATISFSPYLTLSAASTSTTSPNLTFVTPSSNLAIATGTTNATTAVSSVSLLSGSFTPSAGTTYYVFGTNIAAGTTITGYSGGNSITLSANATGSGTNPIFISTFPMYANQSEPRAAFTNDGVNFLLGSKENTLQYYNSAASAPSGAYTGTSGSLTNVAVGSTSTSARYYFPYNNKIYMSSGSGNKLAVINNSSSIPTSTVTPTAFTFGTNSQVPTSPSHFNIVSQNNTDVLYVCEQGGTVTSNSTYVTANAALNATVLWVNSGTGIAVGQFVSGSGIVGNTTVTAFTAAPSTQAATWTAGTNPTITVSATGSLAVGMGVVGTGVSVGATVGSITDATHFVLTGTTTGTGATLTYSAKVTVSPAINKAITGATTSLITFSGQQTTASAATSTTSLSVVSATNLVKGQVVVGSGIPANTWITNVSGTTLTLSNAINVSSGAALTFAYYGLLKYYNNGTNWISLGGYGVSADQYQGVAVTATSASSATIYAIRNAPNSVTTKAGELLSIVDAAGPTSNFSASPTETVFAVSSGGLYRSLTFAPQASVFYYNGTGALNSTSSWGMNVNGTGTAPSDFVSAAQTFVIGGTVSASLTTGGGGSWTVSGSGSSIQLGDGTNAASLTIPSGYSITGTINVSSTGNLINQTATNPTFGTISSGSTLTFAGTVAQTVPAGTYSNLSITNTTATVTAGGNITVSSGINIASGATFDMTTYALTNSGTSYVQNTLAGGLQNTTTVVLGTNANIAVGQQVFLNNLIPLGTTVTAVSSATAATTTTSSTGTTNPIVVASATGIVVGQSVVGTNIPASTVVIGISGSSITLNNAPTATVTGNITFNTTTVTLSQAATASSGNTNTYAISFGSATLGSGTLLTQNTSTTPINTSKIWTFTINFNNATGGQTIPTSTSYFGLKVSNTSGTNTAGGSFTVNGNLDITNANSSLSMGTSFLTCGFPFSTSGNGTLSSQNTSGSGALTTPYFTGQTWNFNIMFNGAAAQTLPRGTNTFNNLIIANTVAAVSLYTSATINGTLTINSGCIFTTGTGSATALSGGVGFNTIGSGILQTISTVNPPLPSGATFSFEVDYNNVSSIQYPVAGTYNGNLNLTGANRILASSGIIYVGGTFTPGAGTITTTGSTISLGSTQTLPTLNYNNLTIAVGTITAPSTLTLGGNFTINSGATFVAPSGNFNVAGNWSNNGTFTHNSGTVVLNGTNQTIAGSTAFNSFTKSVATAATLTFPAAVSQSFAGTLSLNGASGQLLTIASSTGSSVANINLTGSALVRYVSVSYNNNTGSNILATNGTDGGNNTGWTFSAGPVWTGASSTDWNDAANWIPASVPLSTDAVTITKTGANDLAIETSVTVAGISISAGNDVTLLNGQTLTLNGTISNSGSFTGNPTSTVVIATSAAISGSGTNQFNNLTINSSQTLTGGNFSISGTFTKSGTYTASGGTVTFNGTTAQTIPAATYAYLSITNTTSTVTAGGAIAIGSNINIASGATLDMSTYQLTGTTFTQATLGAGSITSGTNTVTLAAANANIVVGQQIVGFGMSVNTVVTAYTPGSTTVTISTNATGTSSGSNNLVFGYFTSGTGTLKTQNTTSPALTSSRNWTFAVIYNNAAGGQSIASATFNNGLTISNTSGTITATGSIVVNGTLDIHNAGSYLSMGTNAISTGTSLTTTGNGTLSTAVLNSSGALGAGITWSFNVVFNGSGTQTLPQGTNVFNNLSINSGSTSSLWGSASYAVNGVLTVNGTLITSSASITGNFTTSGTGVLQLNTNTSSTPLTSGRTYTFEVDYNSTSSQTIVAGNYTILNASAASVGNRTLGAGVVAVSTAFTPGSTGTYTVNAGNTLSIGYNYTLPATLGTNNANLYGLAVTAGSVTAPSTLTILGSFSISGGTFNAPSGNFTVGGDWNNSGGSYNANSGTVVLNGTSQSITGSTSFNNFTKSVSLADVITFPSSQTQNFAGTLTLSGASGQLLSIVSSSAAQANINPAGTRNIDFIAVSGSNNTNGTVIVPTNATNNGNNTNWTLPAVSYVWTGASSTDWNDAANWNIGSVPSSSDAATIAKSGSFDLSIEVSPSVAGLTIGSGNTVILQSGNTLTVNGNFVNTGTFSGSTSSTVLITGTSTISGSGTTSFKNLTINSGDTLTGGSFGVSGTWTNNGTYYPGTGTVTFNGSSAQNIPAVTLYNLTINNTAGVTQLGNVTVNNTLTLTAGNLNVDGDSLTIVAVPVVTSGAINASTTSSIVAFNNTGTITLPANLFSGSVYNLTLLGGTSGSGATVNMGGAFTIGNTINLYGYTTFSLNGKALTFAGNNILRTNGVFGGTGNTGSELVFTSGTTVMPLSAGVYTLNRMTLNGGSVAITNSIAISNTLNLTSGTLYLNGMKLTFGSGSTTINASGGLINTVTDVNGNYITGTYSQLIYTNTVATTIPNVFTGGLIRYLTINGTNTVTCSAAVTIANNGYLNLTTGTLSGSNLTLGTGVTVIRTGGVMSSAPTYTSNISVQYLDLATGSITTGLELPTSSTVLKNLIVNVNAARPLIINSSATINGNAFLWNGNITNSGSLTLANGSTVIRSSGAFDVAPNFAGSVNMLYIQGKGTTGTELPATSVSGLTINANTIASIAVNTGGSGYTTAPSVVIGTPWATGTAYTVGQQVVSNSNLYTCTVAGTSSTASYGPQEYSPSITDGSVTWQFTGFASSGTVSVSSGAVTGITVNYVGNGYSSLPTISLGTPWSATRTNYVVSYSAGSYVTYGSNVYNVTTAGYSGSVAPTVNSGTYTAAGSFSGTPAVFTYAGSVATATAAFARENIYLGSGTSVNGAVNLIGGDLVVGPYQLITNSVIGNSSNYIVTNSNSSSLKLNSLASNTTVPVGNSLTSYTPIQFTTATSNAVTISVSGTLSHTPQVAANTVALQWTLLASGAYTSNVTFQYNSANEANGYTNSGVVLGTYASSAYSESSLSAVSGSDPFTVTKTGLVFPTSTASLYVIGNQFAFVALPDAPASVTPTADNGQVYIAYTAPASNGGGAIIDYTITAIPSSGSNIVRTGITANPYTFTGLTNSTSYTFTIAARNSSGTGATITSAAATPSATTIWNGTSWSAGAPDATQIAIIAANYTSTVPLVCSKLTVNAGITFVNNSTFSVTSTPVVINGTISGTGTVVLAGSSAQIISGTGTVGNLTLNNSNGATVTGGLAVTGVLNLQSGTLTTGGNVILKSTSIANSGILGPIGAAGNSGSISGNITVERFIPKGFRAFRDISANGVYNSANTLYNTWQESGANNPGYGMFITGGAPDSTPSHIVNGYNDANGLDRTLSGYSSAYYYKAGWDTITNTKTAELNPFQSFRVLIRGDRNFNLDTTGVAMVSGPTALAMHGSTTLRATGVPVTGTVTFSTSGITNAITGSSYNSAAYGLNSALNGYTYLANPYACPIVFDSVYNNSSNIKAFYYYLDPTIGSTGAYVSYNASSGVSSNGAAFGKYIQAGQGFLVGNNNSSAPVVVLKEAFKTTGANVRTSVFGTTTPKSMLVISLLKKGTNVSLKMDGAVAVFGNQFSNGLGVEDNVKMNNTGDNLSISEGVNKLSIDGRLPATTADVLGLNLGQLSGADYKFVIDASAYIRNGVAPYLVDAYTKKTTALSTGIDTIAFIANASVAVTYQNRFSIIFKPTTLAVNSVIVNATIENSTATINWNTVGENGVARFEVEKSVDGKNFNKIGEEVAKNTATASYSATDKDAVATTTYYRIKVISVDGTIAYSNIAKLNYNLQLTTYNLFPNPLIGNTLNVQLGNVVAGKYVVSITNALGQKISESTINHAGGNGTHSVSITKTIAKGVYNVTLTSGDSKQTVYQTKLSVQ